jgi:N-acetylglucosamine-6-phosphate deacetylase
MGATLLLGHTDATYEQAKRAEKYGVSAYTHLFNAMPPLHHRDGGAVCAALTGECLAELICDGIHIAPQMIKLAYSLLGYRRTVLISDSMEATGCPDGEYAIAGTPVVVKNGIALTPEGALAGSTLTLDEAVNNLMHFCDIPLTDAILCATENPAKEVGIFDRVGSIDVGKRADLLVLDSTQRLDIIKVMINGRFIQDVKGN